MSIEKFRDDLSDEVGAILSKDFAIEVTKTGSVPHSGDVAITFPNIDAMRQGVKLIETCVLYIDIRRSTELNFTHRQATVAKLYSAFVRAMTRCARRHNGHVRGIVGDRVMCIFDAQDAFVNAVNTAISMNSVSKYVINKHFKANEVTCGIGIDFGSMMATKTGFKRHGHEQQNYRNLVWLGRPANVASKLTDIANKPAEFASQSTVNVGRDPFRDYERWQWRHENIRSFLERFEWDPYAASTKFPGKRHWVVNDDDISGFFGTQERVKTRPSTPPILMTKAVYDGFKAASPGDQSVVNGWFSPVGVTVPGYSGQVIGGDVISSAFKD